MNRSITASAEQRRVGLKPDPLSETRQPRSGEQQRLRSRGRRRPGGATTSRVNRCPRPETERERAAAISRPPGVGHGGPLGIARGCPRHASPSSGITTVGQRTENTPTRLPPAQNRLARRRAQIAAELARLGSALPGTITERHTRCGKPSCACHHDPPRLHGPYRHWTRKIANKTVGKYLARPPSSRRPTLDRERPPAAPAHKRTPSSLTTSRRASRGLGTQPAPAASPTRPLTPAAVETSR